MCVGAPKSRRLFEATKVEELIKQAAEKEGVTLSEAQLQRALAILAQFEPEGIPDAVSEMLAHGF